MTKEALKLALEALENNRQTHHYCEDTWYSCPKHEDGCVNESEGNACNCGADEANAEIDKAITAIKEALAQSEKEPVRLRRGDILRCIETDELCVVWATSTSGKTLIKWGGNSFGDYTAAQIGELFWLEPESSDVEIAAEQSDNYAAFHAGVKFARAYPSQPKEQAPVAMRYDFDGHGYQYIDNLK